MMRITTLTIWLLIVLCLVPSSTTAQEPGGAGSEGTAETLRRLERRLDQLEKENQAIRAENARLLGHLKPGAQPVSDPRLGTSAGSVIPAHDTSLDSPPVPVPTPPPFVPLEPTPNVAIPDADGKGLQAMPPATSSAAAAPAKTSYSPGEGVTISMLNDTSKLTITGNLSGLAIFATDRTFSPGLPLFLFPASPAGLATNTFDLHARQSNIFAQFTGPEIFGLTPGGTIFALLYNDNITTDNYGLLVYYAYGELKNEQMRFAAGLQPDIFNPVGPTLLTLSSLYGSGNAGSYRGQIRFERYVHCDDGSQLTFQVGLSEPISTTVISSSTDPLVEDNGWPNIEARLAYGFGEKQDYMGGRKQRPVEFGVSGVVGQIRITEPNFTRVVDNIWALGCDLQWAITDRLGMKGELFVGQTLGEYNAGVLQNFNSQTFGPIRTRGGFAEIYYYLDPKVHLHCGYGIDNPVASDLAPGQIACNQTFFNTLLWDLSKTFQIGLEVDYRKTNYVAPLKDADGLVVMTQFLWRF